VADQNPAINPALNRTIAFDSPVAAACLLYQERRCRAKHFPASLFAEPMWNMLLELYIADRASRGLPQWKPIWPKSAGPP
jgi:hypothetical protein